MERARNPRDASDPSEIRKHAEVMKYTHLRLEYARMKRGKARLINGYFVFLLYRNHSVTFSFCNVSSVLGPTFTFSAPGPSTCPSGFATTALRAVAAAARNAGSPLSLTFLTLGATLSGG